MDFFSKLGFLYNPQFTDDNAACMVINDDCSVMLLAEAFFKTFTKKELVDAHKSTEVLTAISADSKDKVNEILDKALAMGATEAREPQDLGFMFGRSFSDLDGHIWEIIWMDQSVMK
jgi:predicted lactoylglutathione lyase